MTDAWGEAASKSWKLDGDGPPTGDYSAQLVDFKIIASSKSKYNQGLPELVTSWEITVGEYAGTGFRHSIFPTVPAQQRLGASTIPAGTTILRRLLTTLGKDLKKDEVCEETVRQALTEAVQESRVVDGHHDGKRNWYPNRASEEQRQDVADTPGVNRSTVDDGIPF